MDYTVGLPVVHPTHGAGRIIEEVEQELVAGFKSYVVIEFITKKLTMRVPKRKVEALGIRQVMSENRMLRVMEALRTPPGDSLAQDFKERRTQVENLLRTGLPLKIAEAVRELTWRHNDTHLTKADSRYLDQGRRLLISEISLATDWDMKETTQRIDQALDVAMAIGRPVDLLSPPL